MKRTMHESSLWKRVEICVQFSSDSVMGYKRLKLQSKSKAVISCTTNISDMF